MIRIEASRLREPAAWIMFAVAATSIVVGVERLLVSESSPFGGSASFGLRAVGSLSSLVSPVNTALLLGAVLLATKIGGEALARAKMIVMASFGALAVGAVFGLIGLLGGLVSGDLSFRSGLEFLLTGLASLAMVVIALLYLAPQALPDRPQRAAAPQNFGYPPQQPVPGPGQEQGQGYVPTHSAGPAGGPGAPYAAPQGQPQPQPPLYEQPQQPHQPQQSPYEQHQQPSFEQQPGQQQPPFASPQQPAQQAPAYQPQPQEPQQAQSQQAALPALPPPPAAQESAPQQQPQPQPAAQEQPSYAQEPSYDSSYGQDPLARPYTAAHTQQPAPDYGQAAPQYGQQSSSGEFGRPAPDYANAPLPGDYANNPLGSPQQPAYQSYGQQSPYQQPQQPYQQQPAEPAAAQYGGYGQQQGQQQGQQFGSGEYQDGGPAVTPYPQQQQQQQYSTPGYQTPPAYGQQQPSSYQGYATQPEQPRYEDPVPMDPRSQQLAHAYQQAQTYQQAHAGTEPQLQYPAESTPPAQHYDDPFGHSQTPPASSYTPQHSQPSNQPPMQQPGQPQGQQGQNQSWPPGEPLGDSTLRFQPKAYQGTDPLNVSRPGDEPIDPTAIYTPGDPRA
ncbi:hypothetical protein HNP84_004534 [Thermocatellispora tengchongensis]|uniref:Uncharacterized protein n=1 Tax=Thermocatellispora tengchongensis TaxID=1073253 RepID=A0A840PBK0_9ACTN|nr:hypothetical protein [Thermocatellispora tengchongensis]MBB5134800.1 hypothetical protein [Thermocatellispora tengchongensis]